MTRRADIMREAIVSQTLAASPGLRACVWSPFQGPRPQRPFVEWRPITQPSLPFTINDDVDVLELPREVDVQVLSAVVDQPYRLELNYASASYTPSGGDTVTTVRDSLLASVNADREPVTASAVGADVLRLTGDRPGVLWRVIGGAVYFDINPTTGTTVDVTELQRSMLVFTASMNVYSTSSASDEDSSYYAHEIESCLRSRRVTALLNQEHLALTKVAEPVNLDLPEISGSSFESRTAVDFSISLPYWRSELIESIEDCEITIATDRGSIQV